MDLQQLNDQMNEALNRYWELAYNYFTHLDQMEMYGWAAEGTGLILLVVGIVLL